jgi:uncharacterized protein (DUF488 family)
VNGKEMIEKSDMVLFTIGYEGKDIKEYVQILEDNMVKVVVDVRRNPISRKYGFSKTRMREMLASEGIDYIHLPKLGIESERRRSLKTRADYNVLFLWYENEVLDREKVSLGEIINRISSDKRVALTCFESDPTFCHRSKVSKKIFEMASARLKLVHL